MMIVILLLLLVMCFSEGEVHAADPFASARDRLVDQEIVSAGVRNPRVIAAMRQTPRHEFVPASRRNKAYFDMSLPIGGGQTISPPYVVAYMTEQLDPQPTDRVLEIGTGSGYQAAVLSGIVDQVYSIEIVERLGRRAARTLRRLGYENVHTKIGDGFQGWEEHAPFDKIIVTCSPEDVPRPLVDQLAEGGLMIVPVGERFQQTLYRFTKDNGQLQREHLQATFFVPMTGEAETQRRVKPDLSRPALVEGGFENTLEDTQLPQGWYYVRQAKVVDDRKAPGGTRCIAFANSTPGLSAHAMQAFGIDGRHVKEIEVSYWLQGEQLRPGRSPSEQPGVLVEFYGSQRAPVGFQREGTAQGTFDWKQQRIRLAVPTRARLAVIGIGMFGATGKARFDELRIEPMAWRQTGNDASHPTQNQNARGQKTERE